MDKIQLSRKCISLSKKRTFWVHKENVFGSALLVVQNECSNVTPTAMPRKSNFLYSNKVSPPCGTYFVNTYAQ